MEAGMMYLFIFAGFFFYSSPNQRSERQLAIGLGRRWLKHVVEDRLVLLRP